MALDPQQRRDQAAYVLAHVYEQRRASLTALRAAVRVAVGAGVSDDDIRGICPDDSDLIDAILCQDGSGIGQEPLPF